MKSKMYNMPKADKQKAEHLIWLKLYTLHLPGLVTFLAFWSVNVSLGVRNLTGNSDLQY